jgi:hypothetical protein
VQFGSVSQGTGMQKDVSVSYAGRSDWRIDRVESANPFLEAQAIEVSRISNVVKYNLSVKLKADAPAGYIQDQLFLVTNDKDQRSARVPVAVEGMISQSLSVKPSQLWMGIVEAGQSITKPFVINGKTPFRITSVSSSDPRFQCTPPDDAKRAHLLPVTFNSKNASGKISSKIHIETDYPNAKALDVTVDVQVNPKGE